MPTRRPKRLPGFTYIGVRRYLLTCCTFNRAKAFVDACAVSAAREQIERTCMEERFAILAFCFMPDHVHLLVEGLTDTSDFKRLVKIAKQRVAYVFRRRLKVPMVWQEGYHERIVRSDDATDAIVRYVLDNPA